MFKISNRNNVLFLTINSFDESGLVRHAFSTRVGGVSTGEAASMNFGLNRKDTAENIRKNFEILCGALDIDSEKLVMAGQVHGDAVYTACEKDAGKRIESVDALITNTPGITLCTFHADCAALYFLDVRKKAIGLAHSGWRGTRLNIAAKTIQKMQSDFGSDPSDIIAAISPSIGVCCFETGQDVANEFDSSYIIQKQKPHVNLWQMCKDQMLDAGVEEKNITHSNLCTYCNSSLFYSYRADNGRTGSMTAMIQLTEDIS